MEYYYYVVSDAKARKYVEREAITRDKSREHKGYVRPINLVGVSARVARPISLQAAAPTPEIPPQTLASFPPRRRLGGHCLACRSDGRSFVTGTTTPSNPSGPAQEKPTRPQRSKQPKQRYAGPDWSQRSSPALHSAWLACE